MRTGSRFTLAAATALACLTLANQSYAQPSAQTSGTTPAAVEPAATQALEASRAYLRSLRSFEVRAQTTIQEVIDDDVKVDLLNHVRYEYRAPDRLFIDWQSDRQERRIYYDGRKLTIYAPRVGYYTQIQSRGTVADLLRNAAENYGIVVPLPDLFYWATQNSPVYDLKSASHLGSARLAGVDTDHYLFRQADVDWQVWIERGPRPLPRKIVITDRTDPAQPSMTALLQWNPDVKFDDARFVFTPSQNAQRIAIADLSRENAK